MSLPFDSFEIFPAINIGRVGDSEHYFEGPSVPGLWSGGADGFEGFRDSEHKIKRQAARYRLYGYKNGKLVREITLQDPEVNVDIAWNVQVANKKASHHKFQGILNREQTLVLRNPTWHDRKSLEAITDVQAITSPKDAPKKFQADIFEGHTLNLGFGLMLESGSLLVVPGSGRAGSIKPQIINNYVNNDYWWDETADGPVNASVRLTSKSHPDTQSILHSTDPKVCKLGRAWFIAAPPKFAPAIHNPITMHDVIAQTQGLPHSTYDTLTNEFTEEVEFYKDIWPLLQVASQLAWVNPKAWEGHAPGKSGDLAAFEDILKETPTNPRNASIRKNVLQRIRIPVELATAAEEAGQAFQYYMPILSGNNGDKIPADASTWLTFTPTQYLKLKKWADGHFVVGPKPVIPTSFDRVPPEERPDALNKAALEWGIGGPFYPGIEATFLITERSTFKDASKPFRVADKFHAGDLTKWMALPWQADFYECKDHWWPSTRPDSSLIEENFSTFIEGVAKAADHKDSRVASRATNSGPVKPKTYEKLFKEWDRGCRENEEGLNPKWGNMDMVVNWNELGFIVPVTAEEVPGADKDHKFIPKMVKGAPAKDAVYCELYRTFEQGKNKTTEECGLDDLELLLQTALMFELTTIPPYLYAMYSIKDDTNEGKVAKRVIRSIALEEMLHASIVSNVMTSLGFSPRFYSRETIPFYPSIIPHYQFGDVPIHLSRADKDTIETFRQIESPGDEHEHSFLANITGNVTDAIAKTGLLSKPAAPKPSSAQHASSHLKKFLNLSKRNLVANRSQQGAPKPDLHDTKGFNFRTIAEMYDAIGDLIKHLEEKKLLKWNQNPGKQLDPGMGFAPKMANAAHSTGLRGLIHINNVHDALEAIKNIVTEGEGAKARDDVSDEVWKEHSHFVKFQYISEKLVGKYDVHPVMTNPTQSAFDQCIMMPQLGLVAKAFNASYSYLMLLLETSWQVSEPDSKRTLIVGGMSSLMSGVLASLAQFLVEAPMSTQHHAGPPFQYFEFYGPQGPLKQLVEIVQAAANSFPQSSLISIALNAAQSLPELSYPITYSRFG